MTQQIPKPNMAAMPKHKKSVGKILIDWAAVAPDHSEFQNHHLHAILFRAAERRSCTPARFMVQ